MGYPFFGGRGGYLSGFGALEATSLTTTGDATVGGRTTSAGFTSSIAGTAGVPAYNWSADPNNGPYYSGVADRCEWAAAGADVISLRSATFVVYTGTFQADASLTLLTGRNLVLNGGYIDMVEIASPGVAGANTARIFAIDDTAKTEAAVFFPTGARQQIAQEP